VDMEDLTRHDKWLCMMMPRLKLLHELLAEDGAIFISIDDNEQHNLRCLLDEVFGKEKFIQNIIWEKSYSPRMDAKGFSESHDFILCYSKSDFEVKREIFKQNKNQFKFYDEEKQKYYRRRSLRKEGKNSLREDAPNSYFPLIAPDGTEVYPIKPNGIEGNWRWSLNTYQKETEEGNTEWIKNGRWEVYAKQYYEGKAKKPPVTIWKSDEVGHNHMANDEVREVFGTRIFDSPKPKSLLKRIFKISTDKNDIILDSFAGSGTTAHAVLDLNKEDGGNRRFILVEQESYANTITAERVRRVIQGVPASKNFKEGTGGTFSYFELGKPIEMESILTGDRLPSYTVLARYLFYTATGEEFDEKDINKKTYFIGESRNYEVYLFYQADLEWLKSHALTLAFCKGLPKFRDRQRLVFAPSKYVDDRTLLHHRIDFCQLPYEIYKIQK